MNLLAERYAGVSLTKPERIVVEGLAEDMTIAEIAAYRRRSYHTVSRQAQIAFLKLGVRTQSGAVAAAIRQGIIE